MQNKLLQEEIDILKAETNARDKIISSLEITVGKHEKQLAKKEAQQQYYKLLIAIQDLNALKKLETALLTTTPELSLLHNERITELHYIYTQGCKTDTSPVIDYKLYQLTQRIANMHVDVVARFKNKNYDVLVSEIHAYLVSLALTDNSGAVGTGVVQDVDDWWD